MATLDVTGTYTVSASVGSTVNISGTYTVLAPAGDTYEVSGTYDVLSSSSITADAGLDQVAESLTLVTLSGAGSTGSPTSYLWTQVGGTAAVQLSGSTDTYDDVYTDTYGITPDASTTTFITPAVPTGDVLTFQLTVSKAGATDAIDTVAVTVLPHTEWIVVPGGFDPVRTYTL